MIKLYILLHFIVLFGLSQLHAKALPNFDFSVEVRDESCSSDGGLEFSATPNDPSAKIVYRIFLKPDLNNPYKVQETETLNNLSAGDYRITAIQELNGESSSQQVDVTIKRTYQPLDFDILSEDICQEEDGKITVEMTSGTAISYQIQGPVNRAPQSENTFENLPLGSYIVQVVNACGERLSKTFEILKTGFSIEESMVEFEPLLPSCGKISVGHYLKAAGSGLQYPITLDFTVYVPGGGTETVTSIVELGETYEAYVYGTIPFFNTSSYTYDVQITDACGNVATSENNTVERQLTVSQDMRWGSGSCGERQLAISPINYTAPYTINFMAYPDGFDPASNENFPGPYKEATTLFDNGNTPIPDGTYIFQVTDACGNTTEEIRMEHRQVVFGPSHITYQGCGPDEGSVQLMNYDYNLTLVEIINAPSGYAHSLPHNVSQHIYPSDGRRFAINSLPEGEYEFYLETDCGSSHTTKVLIEGLKVSENEVEIIETCGSFNLVLQHESDLKEENSENFGLQLFDPVSRTWVHPNTGEPYNVGDDLTDQNSVRLFSNNTTYNLPYSGTFRVVKSTENWKNGAEILSDESRLSYCLNTLREFTLDNNIGFTSINSFSCAEDVFDVAINATGYPPISYKITAKDGVPFLLDNGNNPFFQGLEEGKYSFQIQDNCDNILNKVFQVSLQNVPQIIPNNLCHGENGELAVLGMDFLEFEWWKDNDPSTVLSRGSSLSFAPFDRDSDPGLYKVRLTYNDPNSCLNEILEFEIPADDDGPQAGTGSSSELCEGEIVDLFSLLEGPFDDYGYWEEISGSNSLVGNFWTTEGLPAGIYEFIYIVPGLCNGEDRVTLTINLLNSPGPPAGEPIQSFCEASLPTIADLVAEGESILWYSDPYGGTPLPSSQPLEDNTLYYATQTVNGCTSGKRLESKVFLEKPIENNEIGEDQQLARNKPAQPLIGTVPTGGTGIYNYQWQLSTDSLEWEDIPGANQIDFNPKIIGETVFFRRLIKGVCTDYFSNIVKITVITVDLRITKTSFNKEIYDGEEFTYEIFVENTGQFDATQITISDQLPTALDYVSHTINLSSPVLKPSHAVNDKFVSFYLPQIPVGEWLTIQLVVIPNEEGFINNSIGVASREEDADLSDNIAQDQNRILPFFIPNVIKPDFDGKNENFVIRLLDKFQNIELVIFNRWGDHVYESKDYKNDWSAEGLLAGTYYYVVNAADTEGRVHVYKGWVQVIK